jgi:DNA replication ATP-dependent helicase Dna2
MDERAWVFDLPGGALEGHCFESLAGSSTGTQWKDMSPKKKKQGGSPIKGRVGGGGGGGKENRRPGQMREPKKVARIGERALFKGRPVSQNVLEDLMY